MGWSYDDHTEFFTMEDLIEKFSIEKLNPAPAAINFSKLDYFNGLHIRHLAVNDLAERLRPFFERAGYTVDDEEKLRQVAAALQVRLVTLTEAPEKAGFFFRETVTPEPETLLGKGMSAAETLTMARRIYKLLLTLPDFSEQTANRPLRDLAKELGLKAGHVFGFLRNALTAQKVSPPIFETMTIIGRPTVMKRLEQAIATLEQLAAEEDTPSQGTENSS